MASQTNLNWIVKDFISLTPEELYAIARLRIAVFVLEQQCCYQDLDGKDQVSVHLMGFDKVSDALVAYSRIVPPGISFAEPSIGRVITAREFRGQALGRELMERSITLTRNTYPGLPIRIGAQAHLQGFYGRLGFVPEGEIYDEDGIDHVEMVLKNTNFQ